jgi:hypothetical protein
MQVIENKYHQGLKPTISMLPGGTAEGVPFQSSEKQPQVLRLRCASLRMTAFVGRLGKASKTKPARFSW